MLQLRNNKLTKGEKDDENNTRSKKDHRFYER